jgi:hypothetical protein
LTTLWQWRRRAWGGSGSKGISSTAWRILREGGGISSTAAASSSRGQRWRLLLREGSGGGVFFARATAVASSSREGSGSDVFFVREAVAATGSWKMRYGVGRGGGRSEKEDLVSQSYTRFSRSAGRLDALRVILPVAHVG